MRSIRGFHGWGVREVRLGYGSRLRQQHRSDGYSLSVQGRELHHEGCAIGVDVHDGTDVSRQQIVFAVAGDRGGEDDVFVFLEGMHFSQYWTASRQAVLPDALHVIKSAAHCHAQFRVC